MVYDLLPSLKANFTPIPQAFIESVLNDPSVSKNELIVSIFCFQQSFGWHSGQLVVHFELIAKNTSLSNDEAKAGLAAACERNTLILLPGEEGVAEKKLYMLNLSDNRQFVETYYTKNQDAPETTKPANNPHIPEVTVPANAPYPPEVAQPVSGEVSDEAMFDYEEEDEYIPFEDEVGSFQEEVIPLVDGAGSIEEEALTFEPSTPAIETKKTTPQPIDFPEANDSNSSNYLPPGMSLPFHKKTVDMIGKLLGRSLSKAETDRLADLGANDQTIIEAMSSLLAKTKKVYSSDLIVYEYEQNESNKRTNSRYEDAKSNRQEQIERQTNCMKCGGLGYTFQGLNNIHECDCRKV